MRTRSGSKVRSRFSPYLEVSSQKSTFTIINEVANFFEAKR
jgi:hypothetical protein